ncbi:MAG: cysteine desulfurase [Pseudolabrys sp.]|nr:cysteine desulfurase [Pseudolabrys sp.]
MMQRVYFDWNATAPLLPEARAAMIAALETTGNASSVHAEGRAARAIVERARAQVAALVGVEPKQVTFTSGATEANMLALTPHLETGEERAPRDRLFVSAVEHPSVICGGRFAPGASETLAVDADGIVDLAALGAALSRAQRPLVSVMLANNETGVIAPIRRVAEIVHAAGGLLHVDAAQAPGRIRCRMDELHADLMSISAHKLGGPQGVGALIRRADLHVADPLVKGGGQERGLRAGTENVAAIAGFGAAAGMAAAADATRMAALRDRLEAGILAATPEAIIVGAGAARLPNTTLVLVPGMKAETALIAFDLNGIALSSGSACSSGKVRASHVLAAMGFAPPLARAALRISLGRSSQEAEVDRFLETWKMVVRPLLSKEGRELAA